MSKPRAASDDLVMLVVVKNQIQKGEGMKMDGRLGRYNEGW
jgi:hypothetical protein